jgi:hypothetical protein
MKTMRIAGDCRLSVFNPQSTAKNDVLLSCATWRYFGSSRVVLSCCKTEYGYAVTAEAAGSSPVVPAIPFKHLLAVPHFAWAQEGAKYHNFGAKRPPGVWVSSVTRIVEWRSSSCIIFSSAPVDRSSVEYVCRKVCQPAFLLMPCW